MPDSSKAITSRPRIFISYSHDSAAHEERVLGLSERLRRDGFEAMIDQYVTGTLQEDWSRWMLNQLDWADSVLLVCTETYYRRFRGHEIPDRGFGVDWEGNLITNEIYQARSRTRKFVPILFAAADAEFIPEPLQGKDRFLLDSDAAYEGLKTHLTGTSGVEPGALGELKVRPRKTGTPLTFPQSDSADTTIAPSGALAPNLGPTVEQLQALAEAFAKQAGKSHNQQLVFAEFRTAIEASRQQIRPMADYKTAHDLLQEIELSGRALRDQLYERDQLLPAPQIRWRSLLGGRDELARRLRELSEHLAQCPFGANEATLRDELSRAEADLAAAFEARDLGRLDGTIQLVSEILGSQLSRMNDRLIGALDAFDLSRLVVTLRDLAQRLGAQSPGSLAALSGLEAAGLELTKLRSLHDELQQLDNELRNQEALLWSDVGRFRQRWQNRLNRRFAQALEHLTALQRPSRLASVGNALEAALLAPAPPEVVADTFLEVRSELLQVFNRVDRDLRRCCEGLRDTDGPLSTLLTSLPSN